MAEIGLAGLPLDYPNSGTAIYVRNLFPRLPEAAPDLNFRLFLRRPRSIFTFGQLRAQALRSYSGHEDPGNPVTARLDKLTWETVALPLASALRREALLHMPYFAAPVLSAGKLVVTIHDLVPLVIPGYHRGRASAAYSRFMARTVVRADAILTVSEYSKRDIMRVLGIPESKIHVIYEAVDEQMLPTPDSSSTSLQIRYGIPASYVLYMGGAEKRKNIETLVRAWKRVAPHMRSEGIVLVIVARFPPPDPLYPDIPALVREIGLSEDVVIVPEVRDCDKLRLYQNARAFCFPSTYEGFGLTPLESMAAGTPVLAANASSIPEIVGDGAMLLPPLDVGAWADAIRGVLTSESERRSLSEAGRRRVALFSWQRAAVETVAVYRAVLES